MLTTSQLVRLADMPERTVQHRLGVLYRAGFVSRHRPRAAVGTCPYHWWLTPFGVTAIGAARPEPWSEDPVGVGTVAALSDLWLGIEDDGPAAGLSLTGWRRLPDGLSYPDPRTGADRRLGADAELSVGLGRMDVRALVIARIHRVPRARLGSVLARWVTYLAAAPSASRATAPIAALVLTRTGRQRATILDAARGVAGANDLVAVGTVEPGGVAPATDAVWRTSTDKHDRRLVEVLAGIAEVGK